MMPDSPHNPTLIVDGSRVEIGREVPRHCVQVGGDTGIVEKRMMSADRLGG